MYKTSTGKQLMQFLAKDHHIYIYTLFWSIIQNEVYRETCRKIRDGKEYEFSFSADYPHFY